jgi:16S rRNA processing protein RimM
LTSYRETSPAGAVAGFAEVKDRTQAEALRGLELVAQVSPAEEADGWYASELRGARAELPDGTYVGTVADLITGVAQDLLEINQLDGSVGLIPLVEQLVPLVDPAGGRVVVDPPPGLLAARPAEEGSGTAPAPQGGGAC